MTKVTDITVVSDTLADVATSRSARDDARMAYGKSLGKIGEVAYRNRVNRSHNKRALDRMQRGK